MRGRTRSATPWRHTLALCMFVDPVTGALRMHLILVCLLLVFFVTPASAEWKIQRHVDKMTEKADYSAEMRGFAFGVRLGLRCSKLSTGKRLLVWTLWFDDAIGVGNIDVRFRFDDGPVVTRSVEIYRGKLLTPWPDELERERLVKVKHLRVDLTPRFGRYTMLDIKLPTPSRSWQNSARRPA